jgi:hypothetical protein
VVPSLWLSHKYYYIHSSPPHSCYMPCPSYTSWLYHSNYIRRREKDMKLIIMQFSPTSCHLIPLRSRMRAVASSNLLSKCWQYWKFL